MAHDVFISHSSDNRPTANAVCAALESAGIRCWMAPRDVMPGRSYSGEITRAIQQSRAFILIFSQHSNNSEQVLREVQLAANSRLHIVQFRIDAVSPSDDLEYYLSGPHWLDAVTPPLENHLGRLKDSMKALLSLPRADGESATSPAPPTATVPPPPPAQRIVSAPTAPPVSVAKPSTNTGKWIALGIAALFVLAAVVVLAAFIFLRSTKPLAPAPITTAPTISAAPSPAQMPPSPVPQLSVAPKSASSVLTTEEAELYVKEFNRDMERGDLKATLGYLDDTVDYYAFGPKDKSFIAEQMRQYFLAVPVRAFSVGEVKVQAGPKPDVATIIFETRYSVRDALGTPASGRTRTEWDVVRRADGLKIIRTNWITYPDATPSR
ncbi:MAG TPA: toll/interleukin-1 receptor domain-containing protein [Chthoniobacterales bacterium]|nr:toll/interleukin-1 receptor domain-containing protein [Chthoniobacterales bacterium]